MCIVPRTGLPAVLNIVNLFCTFVSVPLKHILDQKKTTCCDPAVDKRLKIASILFLTL